MIIKGVALIAVFALSLLVAPFATEAQQAAAKVWRIGMLWLGSSLEDPDFFAFAIEYRLVRMEWISARTSRAFIL